MLAALLAAIMSTADSQLLVVSSSLTRDLYERVIRRGRALAPRTAVTLGRVVTVLVILAAATLSWVSAAAGKAGIFGTVFSYVLLAWAGLGAAFGPPLLFSLWWRRSTRAGALASFLVGTGVTIAWVATGLKAATGYHEILPAFLLSTAAFAIVSLVTARPEDVDDMMDDMRSTERTDATTSTK